MGNVRLSPFTRKVRRFIAVIAAFALSFSLLGTASIEAFATTIAGDDSQSGNYAAENTSNQDLVYDSVYGVRHGGYALMYKAADENTGAHRLDLVRASDNAVTWSKSFADEEEYINAYNYARQFDKGYLPTQDAGGAYIIDLNGNDLCNGARYESMDNGSYDLRYFVGINPTEDNSLTFTVYGITNCKATNLGTVNASASVGTCEFGRVFAYLEDDGRLWLSASYYDRAKDYRDEGYSVDLYWLLDNGTFKAVDEESYFNDFGYYDYGPIQYYDENGNRLDYLDNYTDVRQLSNGNFLVEQNLEWFILSKGADGNVVTTPLAWTASDGSKPSYYQRTGRLVYAYCAGKTVIYDESSNLITNNLSESQITSLTDSIYLLDDTKAFLNYDGTNITITESFVGGISVRILGESPITGTFTAAVQRDVNSAHEVVDNNLKPVTYTYNGKTYTPALCMESEMPVTSYYADNIDFPNSAYHTCGNYTLAYVTDGSGKYGAIDKNGNVVVPIEYDAYYDANVEDGNDTILIQKEGKWKFYDLAANDQSGSSGGSTGGTSTGTSTGGSTGGSTSADTTTTTNSDGSTTTTVTASDGTKTATTEYTDGSANVTVTKSDGTSTSTTTDAEGVIVTEDKDAKGTTTSTTVKLPQNAIKALEGAVTLPIEAVKAGSDTAVSVKAEAAVLVTVPVTKATGQQAVSDAVVLVAVDANGKETIIPKSIATKDGVAFAMPEGAVTVKVKEVTADLPDIQGHEWFAQEGVADFAVSRGLIEGIEMADGTHQFQGNTPLSRGIFATILHRLESTPAVDATANFADVEANTWYTDSVAWAQGNGIIKGYEGTGHFGPNDAITREQMATIMMRYANLLGLDTSARADLSKFSDAGSLTYGQEAMQWAVAVGLIHGYDGTDLLGADQGATRAEASAVIQRLVNYMLA